MKNVLPLSRIAVGIGCLASHRRDGGGGHLLDGQSNGTRSFTAGLPGVGEQVDQNLLNLAGVGVDDRPGRG